MAGFHSFLRVVLNRDDGDRFELLLVSNSELFVTLFLRNNCCCSGDKEAFSSEALREGGCFEEKERERRRELE